jgi:hypothetical protein
MYGPPQAVKSDLPIGQEMVFSCYARNDRRQRVLCRLRQRIIPSPVRWCSSMSILLQEQFQRWRKVWRPSETTILAASALLVGLTSGIGIWIFKRLIDLAQLFFFGIAGAGLTRYSAWLIFLVPVMGGAVVGLISHFLIGEERFHGVSGIMKAVAFEGGRLRYKRVVITYQLPTNYPYLSLRAAAGGEAIPISARRLLRFARNDRSQGVLHRLG